MESSPLFPLIGIPPDDSEIPIGKSKDDSRREERRNPSALWFKQSIAHMLYTHL